MPLNRAGRFLRRYTLALTVVLLAVSEALIAHWLLLATRGQGLTPATGAALAAALLVSNLLLYPLMRRVLRHTGMARPFVRLYLLGSIAALMTGPPLGLALVVGALGGLVVGEATAAALFVGAGSLAVAAGFGSILWGWVVGQRRLSVERVELPVRDLPEGLRGLRIAHLTDIHVGPQVRGPQLRRVVDRVLALRPDVIAITGDIFDYDPQYIAEGCRELARLAAPHGVYACLGNHDVYTGADAVAAGLREGTSIRVLRDEWAKLSIEGAGLYLLGIDDPGRGWTDRDAESPALDRLAAEIPEDAPRVLLAHRPAYFGHAARLGIEVVLSGHTHGGQISPPAPAHHHNVARLISRWTRGRFEDRDSVLYVSRGVGVVGPPVRLNCPREIALLELVPREGGPRWT